MLLCKAMNDNESSRYNTSKAYKRYGKKRLNIGNGYQNM